MFLNGPAIDEVFVPGRTSYGLTTSTVTSPQAVTIMPFETVNSSDNPELYSNNLGLITFKKTGFYSLRVIWIASPTTAGVAPKQANYRVSIIRNRATTNDLIYSQEVVNNGVLTFPSPVSPGPYGTTVNRIETMTMTAAFYEGDTVGAYMEGLSGVISNATGSFILYCVK